MFGFDCLRCGSELSETDRKTGWTFYILTDPTLSSVIPELRIFQTPEVISVSL